MRTVVACFSGLGAIIFGLLAGIGNGMFGIPNVLWWIPTLFSLLTFLWALTDSSDGMTVCGLVAIATGVVAPWLASMNLSWFNNLQTFVVDLLTKVF